MGNLIRLAKEYMSNPEQMFNTNTVSTLEYMSPETLNQSVYLKQSDVYSFGLMAYELVSEAEFSSLSGYQHIDAITNKKYRPSLEGVIDNEDMRQLIEQAWDDDWKARPTMGDICAKLAKIRSEIERGNKKTL